MGNTVSQTAKKFSNEETNYDIITFATSPQGLNIDILPSQRFLLKVLNKVPLDNTVRDIPVMDMFNREVLGLYTEVEFWQFFYEGGRLNLTIDEYYSSDIIRVILALVEELQNLQ